MTDLREGQTGAAAAVNAALLLLDSTVQLWVNDAAPTTTPPASGMENGHAYIVPASATGDWASEDDKIAIWQSGWTFIVPRSGWRCWDEHGHRLMIFRGRHGGGGYWAQFQATYIAPHGTLAVPTTFGETGTNDNALATKMDALLVALITAGLMAGTPLSAAVVDDGIGIADDEVSKINP